MNDIRSCWECRYENECRRHGYLCYLTYEGNKECTCVVKRYQQCEDCALWCGYCLKLKLHMAAEYGTSVTK